MATKELNRLGITEIAKRTNNGNVVTVAEVLSRYDEWLEDAVWIACNNVGSHVHTRRMTLPDGTWRTFNAGATIESSVTKQVVENVGRLESWSQVDEAVVQTLLGDQAKFLSTEEMAFVMGLGQTLTETFVGGDTVTTPEKFDGLRIRTNALGTYVKGVGGAGSDTTSIFFIQWGEQACHMIYQPAVGGASPGAPVMVNPQGLETIADSSGGLFRGYRTQFVVTAGLAVHDDRCLTRLTNIEDDVSGTNIFEPDYAVELLRSMIRGGKGAYGYAHQKVLSQIDVLAMDKVNALYTINEVFGEQQTMFRGIPLRQLDAIGLTETAVA